VEIFKYLITLQPEKQGGIDRYELFHYNCLILKISTSTEETENSSAKNLSLLKIEKFFLRWRAKQNQQKLRFFNSLQLQEMV
jgi:hypothetical protein